MKTLSDLTASASWEAVAIATMALGAMIVMLRCRSINHKKLTRRASLASAMQAARPLLESHIGMRQNMVNAILFFQAGDAPTRDEMVEAMSTLASRFVRIRSQPYFPPGARTCEWRPIENLGAAIERAIIEENAAEGDNRNVEQAILKRVEHYKAEMVLGEDDMGRPMPYWRVIVLKPSAVLIRIDHSIGDGLTLVTLLQVVGRKADGTVLHLRDLSPLLRRFDQMGDLTIALRPLQLLWLPNLWRAISLIKGTFALPQEPPNPLRPLPKDWGKVCPIEHVGTVYLPTLSLSLFKRLAQAAGPNTTINDIFLLCLSDAIRRYFQQANVQGISEFRLLLPISNPLPPSLYGDELRGLCNHMTPVVVPLDITNRIATKPQSALEEIQSFMSKVKRSKAPLLMTTVNALLDPLLTLDQLASGSRPIFERVSCIYSNVPGPTESVSIAGHKLEKIQTILPHPVSIFQILSYNDQVYFNMTLDMRSAPKPWLLRESFLDAIRHLVSYWSIVAPDLKEELDAADSSGEWGGHGLVYSCG